MGEILLHGTRLCLSLDLCCRIRRGRCTVHVDKPGPVTNQAFCRGEKIPHAYAEADARDDIVAVFVVDNILDGLVTGLVEVLGCDLYQVLNRSLH